MDFSKRLVHSGRWKGMIDYEPALLPLSNGERVNLVAQVTMRDDVTGGGHWCTGVLTGQRFRLLGKLPTDSGCPKVTVLNAAKSFYRWPILVVDEMSEILIHPPKVQKDLLSLTETCTGLGGIGCGAQYAGWAVGAQNDINEKFVEAQTKVSKSHVIHGDIGHVKTISALHHANPSAGTMPFGFSCQPYSTAGDRKEGSDPRAQCLPLCLYATFLLQIEIIIAECVPGAATSKFVLECLNYYMELTASDRSEVLLELADLWPSHRRRWWTVILKQYMGKVALHPFPKLRIDPTVACLLPEWSQLTPEELASLMLTSEERKGFASYGKGIGANLVEKHKAMATALHSWGNQLVPCACGCRGPFSHDRLSKHGLFGALVHVPGMPPHQNLRHLSAREAALLSGFPKADGWDFDPRLMLAGIGQLASPLQAAWVFSQLRNHLIESRIVEGPPISPKEILTCVTTDLFDLRDKWSQSRSVAAQLFQEQFDEWLLSKPDQMKVDDPPALEELSSSQEAAIIRQVSEAEGRQVASSPGQSVQSAPEPEYECPRDASLSVSVHVDHPDFPGPAKQSSLSDPAVSLPNVEAPGSISGQDSLSSEMPAVTASHVHPDEPVMSASPVPESKSAIWEPSGAISAFSTKMRDQQAVPVPVPSPEVKSASRSRLESQQLPPQVCCTPQDLLEPGIMVYDVDSHTISHHRCNGEVTFSQWLVASHAMLVDSPCCRDLFGNPIDPHMPLVQLKWILVSQSEDHFNEAQASVAQAAFALSGTSLPRIESILLQGASVASDEMEFYLQSLASVGLAKVKTPFIMDGMTDLMVDANSWLMGLDYVNHHNNCASIQSAHQWIHTGVQDATATAVWVNNHWIPVWIVPGSHELGIHTTFEGAKVWEMLFPWWPTLIQVHDDLPTSFSHDCGFRTFAWLVSQSTQTCLNSLTATEAWGWRHLYWQHYLTHPKVNPVFVLGGQTELETAINAILREHGVFPNRLQERTAMLLRTFPNQELVAIFRASRPWQSLKHLASTHQPAIRLVMEDELQAAIKARTKDKKSVHAKAKTPNTMVAPMHVLPQDIMIPAGIFCLKSGEPIAQISPQQLGQHMHGVVAFTEEEVQPYLQHTPPGVSGVGFLVLSPYSEAIASQGQVVRFPVQSKSTSEPMLVSAVLLQKGSLQVTRSVPTKPHAVEQVATQTVKCLIYKDQIQDRWEAVTEAPVKYIIKMFECLQVCKTSECGCPKWHSSKHRSDTPILDVWQRDFLSLHFQKSRPADAQMFAVAMRVTAEVYASLFTQSGASGIYFEPRSDDGKSQDPRYHTIWVPKQTFSAVQALQSLQSKHVSLIRVTHRFGFKVQAEDAEEVHRQINPEEPFIAGASRMSYRVGPFPWGTTKKAIQQLFQTWNWPARPIHSIAKAKDSSGLMWLVHSATAPISTVFQLEHGDVVIHQDVPPPKTVWRSPQVQASAGEFREPPPAQEFDPWAEAARKLPRQEGLTPAQLSALEASVEDRVVKKLQSQPEPADDPMTPQLEPRVAQLEQQLAALQTRSGHIETKVDMLHQQVEQQASKFEAALDSKLSDQMQRIEALMVKRARAHE